jgi:hypothetical protein
MRAAAAQHHCLPDYEDVFAGADGVSTLSGQAAIEAEEMEA